MDSRTILYVYKDWNIRNDLRVHKHDAFVQGNDFVPAGLKFEHLYGRLNLPLIYDRRIHGGTRLFHTPLGK